ncbi:MAG TPA: tetratricopeptide repeat protein [Alcaligenaceae bacterium]|nr:tetratricopeptide repeat protein [Alcaligenaceae bacterium]
MKPIYITLAALFLANSALAQPTAEQRLLEQIQRGEALYRDDIVDDALERLYRIRPQHTEGLLAEIRIAIRLGKVEQAEAKLAELKQTAPDSAAYKEGALLVYLASDEASTKLSQARLLNAAGRFEAARQAYDELLKGSYPTAELAQEYWQVRVNQTKDYATAISALTPLLSRFDQHPALLKTLANFHFSNDNPAQALSYLHTLAEHPIEKGWAAEREYDYLRTLPVSAESEQAWTAFLKRYSDIETVVRRGERFLVQQQQLLNDPAWHAGQAGLQLVENEQNPAKAISLLNQAVAAYPKDVDLLGALGLAYLRQNQRVQALRYFEKALEADEFGDRTSRWVSLIESTRYWLLLNQAQEAAAQQNWTKANGLYQQAYRQDPSNVFAVVGLADSYLGLNDQQKAWTYYQKATTMAAADETAQRGVLRYAATLPTEQALALLEKMPAVMQKGPLFVQAKRGYQVSLLQDQAKKAQEDGRWNDAIVALQQAQQLDPNDPWLSYNLATALRDQGRTDEAVTAFNKHLALHPNNSATRYAHGLLLASLSQWQEALDTLAVIDRADWTDGMQELLVRAKENQLLEQADRLYAAGQIKEAMALLDANSESNTVKLRLASWAYENADYDKAITTYQAASKQEPLSGSAYRDMARAWQALGREPQQALDWFAQGMLAEKLLPAEALSPERDNVAFTRAMRIEDDDDWLKRGLRQDAETLYQQQNPTITVHNDSWWRSDGTPGISELNASTTIVHLDYPIKTGTGYIRADHVRMNAGTLETDAQGVYTGEFGTCSQAGSGGCTTNLKQKASGTSVAVGWQGDKLAFDLGTTPQGFTVSNWTGGISYDDKFGLTGWRLTASRRPMSNSLLSFAGAKDPRTGRKWGGVMATGAALSLSWDQGEANGVWADMSHHYISGKNVDSNSRTRLMGGYYRRLINENNEILTVGVNAMHWRYRKDLGDYSFRQGGYYSPKQYNSISLPVSYSKRTADWSFTVQGGPSFSQSKNHQGESSQGVGYSFNTAVERRINNHLVVGAALNLQRSEDYSPNRGMLYLRYYFEPWQGSLPLGTKQITPYADFK